MEKWNGGKMDCWKDGILERWNIGKIGKMLVIGKMGGWWLLGQINTTPEKRRAQGQ